MPEEAMLYKKEKEEKKDGLVPAKLKGWLRGGQRWGERKEQQPHAWSDNLSLSFTTLQMAIDDQMWVCDKLCIMSCTLCILLMDISPNLLVL